MYNMKIFVLLILIVGVHSAIQLDNDCLENPARCDDDAFSVADFVLCSGEAYPLVDGAGKGTGNRANGCSFGEECIMVITENELNNETWGTNATAANGGCEYLKYIGPNPTAALLNAKKEACRKWLSEDVGVCQGAIWVPIVIWSLVVVVLISLILVAIYIKYPDMLPANVRNVFSRKQKLYQRLPRNF